MKKRKIIRKFYRFLHNVRTRFDVFKLGAVDIQVDLGKKG